MRHENEAQAQDTFLDAFMKSQGHRWMAVVLRVDEDNQIQIHKTSWEWKDGDRMAAVAKLTELMTVEERQNEMPAPLPVADLSSKLDEIRRATILKLREKNDADTEDPNVEAEAEAEADGDVQGGEMAGGCCCDPEEIGGEGASADGPEEIVRPDFGGRSGLDR